MMHDMSDYWSHVVKKTNEAAVQSGCGGISKRAVDTPAVDEPEGLETETPGKMADHAASLIGSYAYAAYNNDYSMAGAVAMRARHTSAHRVWDDKSVLRMGAFAEQFKAAAATRVEHPLIPVQRVCHRDFAEAGALELHVQVDSDHGGDLATRKSTTGYLILLVGKHGTRVVLCGCSKLQPSVSLSTAEAEVTAIAMAAKRLLGEVGVYETLFGPLKILIHTDASAAFGAIKRGLS